MNKNRPMNGSLCLTDLMNAARQKHSAFNKGKNGKIYCNVTLWINAEKDKYDNDAAMHVNRAKDSQDEQFYIGNFKYSEPVKHDYEADEIPELEYLPW